MYTELLLANLKMYRYITCIFLPGLLIGSVLSEDCVYQVCNCEDMFIYCDGRGLIAIPPLLPYRVGQYQNLVFDKNQITKIPAGSLPSGLTQISFEDNPISTIDDNAFNGSAATLQTLIFSFANLTKIPNALLRVNNLLNLDIYDSNVLDWNDDVMRYLGASVQNLILSNVNLPAWPSWMQYFVNITELSLVNCNLAAIPDDGLDMVANTLVSLTLTGNSLTTVPKALSKLTVLEMLFLDENKIADTRWLPASSRLSDLSLNNNNIFNASQLSQSLLPIAAPLSDLDIVNNKLTSIPDVHFLNLGGFDLSYNMISDPYSGALPPDLFSFNMNHNFLPLIPSAVSILTFLAELKLPSNSIKEIDGTKLPKNITFLDLRYNLIPEIIDTSFPIILPLKTLFLNNNPIKKISVHAFRNLPNMVELELGSTQLTRLPLALSSLKALILLDFTGIPGLVCTCLEKSLGPLFLPLSPDNLRGDCGRLSIHDFFSMLSPSCP